MEKRQPNPNEKYFRSLQIRQDDIDEDARTAELSFSSDDPYQRFFGIEILDHKKSSVNLSRLNTGGNLLCDHDRRDVVGVIEKAYIGKDSKGRAVVRFGRSARAEEVFQDVKDGIRQNVSVGYTVQKWEITEAKDGDKLDTYRAVKWTPLEVSLVSIPADATVGVGRSDDSNQTQPLNKEQPKMENLETKTAQQVEVTTTPQTIPTPAEAQRSETDILEAERKRSADISALATRFNMREAGDRAINEGWTLERFQGHIIDTKDDLDDKPLTVADPSIGLGGRDLEDFSLFRALRALAYPNQREFVDAAAHERAVSDTCADKFNKQAEGFMLPYDLYISREVPFLGKESALSRALSAGTATAGEELVATNLLTGSFIDVLRSLNVVMSMGARVLTGLVGDVAIPRKTAGASAAWVATEGGNVAESSPTFDQVAMSPATLGAYTEITRNLLLQSSMDVEALVRDDLIQAVSTAINVAALYGSGASGQPTGVSNQTGINAPGQWAAAVPTWAETVAMESAVAVDNALLGSLGYIVEPAMRGSLKTTEKATGTAQFIWDTRSPNTPINGYKTGVTSQVVSGDMFFGNWMDLLIGFWGALDVLIDPYTKGLAGTLRIVIHNSIDTAVRHPESFAFENDSL